MYTTHISTSAFMDVCFKPHTMSLQENFATSPAISGEDQASGMKKKRKPTGYDQIGPCLHRMYTPKI